MLAMVLITGCARDGTQPPIVGQQNQVRAKHATSSCPCLYVTNWAGQSITVYPVGATGNVAPIAAIAGPQTGIDLPYGVALDASGNIYVTNFDDNSITIYAAGANGNVSPAATIMGSNTKLLDPEGIGIDPIHGNIYVQSLNGPSGNPSILVFAAGSNGNVSPAEVIEGSKTGLTDPVNLTFDGGANIYDVDVANFINVYAAGTTGNKRPARKIKGGLTKLNLPFGVTVDSSSNVYGANNGGGDSSITVYASGATGNVAPIQRIKGKKTQLTDLHGVAVDASRNIYGSNGAGEVRSCSGCNFIAVYASGATGNVAPIRMIAGTNTGLDGPSGLAIH
jgi:hypothetical protein